MGGEAGSGAHVADDGAGRRRGDPGGAARVQRLELTSADADVEALHGERAGLAAHVVAQGVVAQEPAQVPGQGLVVALGEAEAGAAVDDALIAIKDNEHAAGTQASNAMSIHLVRRTRSRRPKREQIYLAVHRHDDTVFYKRLAREDYLLLRALESNVPLGAAMEATFAESKIAEADRPAYIQSVFQYLMQMGWLCEPEAR